MVLMLLFNQNIFWFLPTEDAYLQFFIPGTIIDIEESKQPVLWELIIQLGK